MTPTPAAFISYPIWLVDCCRTCRQAAKYRNCWLVDCYRNCCLLTAADRTTGCWQSRPKPRPRPRLLPSPFPLSSALLAATVGWLTAAETVGWLTAAETVGWVDCCRNGWLVDCC